MSIFADDWRDCLREQFKYVVRQQDSRTEATLVQVLYEAGFDDDELAALRLEATMRAEDMPADYVPDEVRQVHAGVEVPPEVPTAAPEDMPLDAAEADEVLEPEPEVFEELPADVVPDDPDDLELEEEAEDDPDAPQQMSLF